MVLFKKVGLIVSLVSLLVAVAAGCGKSETGSVSKTASPEPTKSEPISLKFYQYGLALTDADFQKLFVEPVKRKYPYITLELVRVGDGQQPQDLLAAGTFPDILFSSNPNIQNLDDLGVLADLAPFVKKNNSDLSRFEPVLVDAIKQTAKNGTLEALPFSRNFSPLFYNKDLFDKFGVGYPKDGMTWDDVYALAQKVTRTDGGVTYRGFDDGQSPRVTGSMISLNLVDPKTEKSDINTDGWKRVFSMFQKMFSIPGNLPDKATFNALVKVRTDFGAGKLAMFLDWGNAMIPMLQDLEDKKTPLNWDMVTAPNFPEALGTERGVDLHLFEISALSKHQDDAFKVIDFLTSKEVALLASRGGRVSALTDEEVKKSFGTDSPALKGKHLDAIFKSKPAKLTYPSKYNGAVATQLTNAFKSVMLDNVDMNTALRNAQEAADKAIQTQKTQ